MSAEIPEETLHALLRDFCRGSYFYYDEADFEKRIDSDVRNAASEDSALIRLIRATFAAGRESVYRSVVEHVDADVDAVSLGTLRQVCEVSRAA